MPLNPGDLPNWIEAIATSGAFIATTRLLYIEASRRKSERRDEVEYTALRVSYWLHVNPDGSRAIKFRNASYSPVYYVELHLYLNGATTPHVEKIAQVNPTDDTISSDRLDSWLNRHMDGLEGDFEIILDLFFTDASGRNWVKSINGTLEQLESRSQTDERCRLRRYALPKCHLSLAGCYDA